MASWSLWIWGCNPACRAYHSSQLVGAHLLGPSVSTHVIPLFHSCFFFMFVDFCGFLRTENCPPGVCFHYKDIGCQVWIWMPSQVHWVVLCSAWCGSPKFMGLSVGMVENIKKYVEEMPKDDVLEKKGSSFQIWHNMAVLLSCTHL